MRTINLTELTSVNGLEVTNMIAMRQRWREGQIFTMEYPRNKTALLWLSGCRVIVGPKAQEQMQVPVGALLCIPEESEYSLKFLDCMEGHNAVLIEFCLRDGAPFSLTDAISILDAQPDAAVIALIGKLLNEFSVPSRNYLEIQSKLLKLLSLLAKRESQSVVREKYAAIEKGIQHLQMDERQELSVDEIAKLCFVTPAYFRRKFREYANMSPLEYRNYRKIQKAKEFLEYSDFSVKEIAELLGFDNPAYFCRFFKRITGTVPSIYRKEVNGIEK